MSTLVYLGPLFLVILCNILYHLISKTTSAALNPFAALTATYGMAFLGSIALLFLTKRAATLSTAFAGVSLRNFLLGFVIIGIEGGYLILYQKGWEVSRASVIANICVAILLFVIGIAVFHENLTSKKLLGFALCLLGIVFINSN